MLLSEKVGTRNNNFNLIRMVAAGMVLVSHAYPLTLGAGFEDPLFDTIGITLGWTAVAVFFVISGFLITRSFDSNSSVTDWLSARVMRLFPGLAVALLLTVFVLGPAVTVLPVGEYFLQKETITYWIKNMMLFDLQYDLPGVFTEQPYGPAINGSLWTLIHEVLCYAAVMIAGLLGLLKFPRLFLFAAIGYVAFYMLYFVNGFDQIAAGRVTHLLWLSFPFLLGMLFYQFRSKIYLSWRLVAVLGLFAILSFGTVWFREAFIVWLAYSVFVVSYKCQGWVLNYNRIGDYSYGLYIYAFPFQQLAVYIFTDLSPYQNMLISAPLAVICAVLSWHLVEKPALGRRQDLANLLKRAFRLNGVRQSGQ